MSTTTLEPDTEQDVDTTLLEHLDQDWAVPCEMRDSFSVPACGARATWWLICRSCGHAIAECDLHRAQEAARFDGTVFRQPGIYFVRCLRCVVTVPAAAWASLFIVEPIGVRP